MMILSFSTAHLIVKVKSSQLIIIGYKEKKKININQPSSSSSLSNNPLNNTNTTNTSTRNKSYLNQNQVRHLKNF